MNSDFKPDPRAEQEAQITALLLGELPPAEAEATRRAIESDPELARLHRALEKTIGLVRDASAEAVPLDVTVSQPLRLAEAKREALLRRFKTTSVPVAPLRRQRGLPWQAQLSMAAALAILIGLVVLQPGIWRDTGTKRKAGVLEPSARQEEVVQLKDVSIPKPGLRRSSESAKSVESEARATLGAMAEFPKEQAAPVTTASPSQYYAFGGGGGGFGGGGEAVANEPLTAGGATRVPILGDVPALGQYFDRKVAKGAAVDAVSVGNPDLAFSVGDTEALVGVPGPTPGIGAQGGSPPTPTAGRQAGRRHIELSFARDTSARLSERNPLAAGDKTAPREVTEARARELAEARGDTLRRGFGLTQELAQKVKRAPEQEVSRVLADKPQAAPVPQPEVQAAENALSTFSLNVTDVSFKLAAANLEKGVLPPPGSIRSEEFINAFAYHDPRPKEGEAVSFTWDRARYPFAQERDVLRLSIGTAARAADVNRPLNLVVVLDRSGSMERADRVRIVREALGVLAGRLRPQDTVSVVTFARTARLFAEAVNGTNAGPVLDQAAGIPPEGGTNLEDALGLAYGTALRRESAGGVNRIVLFTDGAANLGNVQTDALQRLVQAHRERGVALDCFGVGWEGYNDDLLQVLSSSGDGRYGFLNTPEDARASFAGQVTSAFQVAAADVKVQVEFNPKRVLAFRQVGYAKHQLTAEQFRDNRVDAAELGTAESGNALYVLRFQPGGDGPIAQVRVRYKAPGTNDYREQQWPVPYTGDAEALDRSGPALRLAVTAAAFSEWLAMNPFAAEVTPDRLLNLMAGVPEAFASDPRPKQLEWMIRHAKSLR